MKKTSRKRKLFHPDKIATEIHQALYRDFREAQQMQCLRNDLALYALNRQVSEFLKKYQREVGYDKDKIEAETFAKFRDVNAHMATVNDELAEYFQHIKPGRINQSVRYSERIFLRARGLILSVLGPDCQLEDVFLRAKHSSGSSLGVPYSDTSPEAKFTFPITLTSRVKPLMKEYLAYDTNIREALFKHQGTSIQKWYTVVEGSRATTVDKTDDKRRFICVEPTGNMFLQQGLMQMMYERLASFGIVLPEVPDQHRVKAKESSISCREATIDWSSASDCVSIEVLRWLLPPAWFQMVWDLRCDVTLIEGEPVTLNMISSMGNATTFPLETLVFWSLGMATVMSADPRNNALFPEWKDSRLVSVFGDDCIIPTQYASSFIEVCECVGFIINEEKSFYSPTFQFRESCGGDYLAGFDVRPFFLKAPTSNRKSALEPWLYIIGNSLLRKYILYFGELSYVYLSLWETFFGLFDRYKLNLKFVPDYFPDDAGFKGGFDLQRVMHHYSPRVATIHKGNHGTYTFQYCHFRYWKHAAWNEDIRYAIWLKNPVLRPMSSRVVTHEYPKRVRGGYVVASAISSHWELPSLKGPRTLR